jgi:phosphocarrier protein
VIADSGRIDLSDRASVKVTISNRLGLHARPAMCFVDAANQFACSITVAREGGQSVDGKSIMQMMMLAATKGTELQIIAEGADAQGACDCLKKLVESGFDEE